MTRRPWKLSKIVHPGIRGVGLLPGCLFSALMFSLPIFSMLAVLILTGFSWNGALAGERGLSSPASSPGYLRGGGILLASRHPASPPAPRLRVKIPRDPFSGLGERFRRLAKADDKAKNWGRALVRWEAVASLKSGDTEARKRIQAIRSENRKRSARHFQQARKHLKKKAYSLAFKEYLRTLSYDPGHKASLVMVKKTLNSRSLRDYKVRKGDTARKIAGKIFGDPKLAFLVNYFGKSKGRRFLKPGEVIRLPIMVGVIPEKEPGASESKAATIKSGKAGDPGKTKSKPRKKKPPRKPRSKSSLIAKAQGAAAARTSTGADAVLRESAGPQVQEKEYDQQDSARNIKKAEGLYKKKNYAKAAMAAESALEEDPANPKARKIFNKSHYAEGKLQNRKKDYIASMKFLSRVEPGYKDTKKILARVRSKLKDQQAEVHYITGVTLFLDEDLDGAIREWALVLRLDPKHPQARKDLANARSLQGKLARLQ